MERLRGMRSEAGTGVVSSAFGALVFLSFLLIATQTLVGLYGTSVAQSVLWDEARLVATDARTPGDAQIDAERRLGALRNVAISCNYDGDSVNVHLDAERKAMVPAALVNRVGLLQLPRSVRLRHETLR